MKNFDVDIITFKFVPKRDHLSIKNMELIFRRAAEYNNL